MTNAKTYFKEQCGFDAEKQLQIDCHSVVKLMEGYAAFIEESQCSTLRASLLAAVHRYTKDADSRDTQTANRARVKISTLRSVLLLIDELYAKPLA